MCELMSSTKTLGSKLKSLARQLKVASLLFFSLGTISVVMLLVSGVPLGCHVPKMQGAKKGGGIEAT